MTSATDAGRLVAILAQLQRRALVTLAVRYICAAVAVAALVAEAMLMATPAAPRLLAMLGGVALAAVAAAVAAWFRAPAIRETAHLADRRLRLQNRLVTAFQYRDATDEFSRLVIQDALSRAAEIRPASAFPLSIPGWVRFVAVTACVAPLAFTLAMRGTPEFWQRASIGDSSRPGALSIPSTAGNRDSAASPEAAGGAVADGAPRVPVDATPVPQEAGNGGTPPGNVDSSTARANTGGRGGAAGERSGSGRAGSTPQGASTQGGGAGRGSGAAGSPQTEQAGGFTGEPRSDTDVAGARRSAEPARDPAYRSAWSTSQRAIAQEHIPSALREYVRQYFLAIRPADAP